MISQDDITKVIAAIFAVIGIFFVITPEQQAAIIPAIVAIISAILAYFSIDKKAAVIEAFTPGTAAANNPVVVKTLPKTSWTMDEATKRWLTLECPLDVKESMLRQVANAEALGLTDYEVNFPGGHHHIQYGLVYSGSGNCGKGAT